MKDFDKIGDAESGAVDGFASLLLLLLWIRTVCVWAQGGGGGVQLWVAVRLNYSQMMLLALTLFICHFTEELIDSK